MASASHRRSPHREAGGEADVRTPAPALELRGVTKRFGDVLANDRVDLVARAGEVLALLGENGAGKSTLVKIAYGFVRPDTGTILRDGDTVRIGSPEDARRAGIGMLFQQFTLIPAFTVAENLALFVPGLPALIDMSAIATRVTEISGRYGIAVDPARRAGELSAGEQQRVEILKLLLAGSRVLIFDEPTSVLVPQETAALFAVFERLRADGYAIVFITHKLAEALACAQRIVVMRAGRVTGTLAASDASEGRLIALMFESAPPEHPVRRAPPTGVRVPLLELRGIAARGARVGLTDVDLEVRAGEILGIAGVAGNGQRELADAILGIARITHGMMLLFGDDATSWSIERIRDAGVASIPEQPMALALAPRLTLEENMALGDLDRYTRARGLTLDWTRVRHDLVASLERIGVHDPPLGRPIATLSGGNVQRFVFARELARDPKLLVAVYPTRGLDVLTAASAQQELLGVRERGAGVLLISQDLAELLTIADRIHVLREGRIVGSIDPAAATPLDLGRLMTGAAP